MTAPLRDLLQRALGDTVLLQRELGGGGMSRVFLARDESLGRDVVVKVLSPELAAGLSAERFTREIKLAASLQEPHIVPVLTAGATSDGLPWFTMPFVSGESLRTRLARSAVPTAEALGILRNVAQALAYAHARGIVHRDIKPDNVLLSSGTAVVADFGIAKALNASRTQANDTGNGAALTQAGMAIGTPAYMAPEQATGDSNTDHRADIYAWGVLADELLQGAVSRERSRRAPVEHGGSTRRVVHQWRGNRRSGARNRAIACTARLGSCRTRGTCGRCTVVAHTVGFSRQQCGHDGFTRRARRVVGRHSVFVGRWRHRQHVSRRRHCRRTHDRAVACTRAASSWPRNIRALQEVHAVGPTTWRHPRRAHHSARQFAARR